MTSVREKRQAPRLQLLNDSELLELLDTVDQEHLLSELSGEDAVIWSWEHLRTERNDRLEFSNRRYLVDIYNDFSKHLVFKKAAQTGLTQTAINKILFVSDKSMKLVNRSGITSIYTFPTAKDVYEFSKARFTTIVRSSPYLHSRIRDYDNAGMKRIGDSTIYFRGTRAESQSLSVPSDVNIHDELDFSEPSVRDTYSARLSVSELKWEWDFSTPTIPDYGIDYLFKQSDQHKWFVKCTSCSRWQQISYFKNLFRSARSKKSKYYFGCRRCQKELDRSKGKWVARKPKKEIRGYYIPQMICGAISADYMVEEHAKAESKTGGLKKFYNFNLGKTYQSGIDIITKKLIKSRIVPGNIERGKIFVGADQGDILHVEITKLTDGRRRIINLLTLSSFEEFADLLDSVKPHVAVLDALPNHQDALKLAKKHHNLYIAYYDGKTLEKKDWDEKKLKNKEIHVPRTELLDETASLWNQGEILIENHISPVILDEFVSQMSNMKRDMIEIKKTEELVPKWLRTGPDHYRHADAYNYLAMYMSVSGHSTITDIKPVGHPDLSLDVQLFGESEIW